MNPDLTIREMVKESHACSVEKGWWDEYFTQTEFGPAYAMEKVRASIPEKLCLIHSEVSEALECYREGERGLFTILSESGKPEGLPSELADVVIRVADLCAALGIDLAHQIEMKQAYNRTRSRRHGGKVC